jgi:probable rRNA maturation factor
MVEVVNKQRLVKINAKSIARLAEAVIQAVETGRGGIAATVAIVTDGAIRKLNSRYRGKDQPTDVLSFPSGDDGQYLGDVVISANTAARQARDSGNPVQREIGELVIHGILHLFGYDHETDDGEMNRLELRIRRQLLADP